MKNNNLSTEQLLFLDIIKDSLLKEDFIFGKFDYDAIDWTKILYDINYQVVTLLSFETANKIKRIIPNEIFKKWQNYAYKTLAHNTNVFEMQKELISVLRENEVEYIIIKGTSAAVFYSEPNLRSLGDIDFLICKDQKEYVKNLLIKYGYDIIDENSAYDIGFRKNNVIIEMHFDIPGVPDGAIGEHIHSYLSDIFDKSIEAKFDQTQFISPCNEHHALILMLHMQHHMLQLGLGIRHLCDWACFINETADESFWENGFLNFLSNIGMLTYAKSMTKTCATFLGSYLPDWAKDISDTICYEIIDDVFKSGDFGRKNKTREKSRIFISKHSKFLTALLLVHRMVMINYPFVKFLFILYPFLYIWRCFKYLILMLFGKRESLRKMLKYADERKSVYEKLNVFK